MIASTLLAFLVAAAAFFCERLFPIWPRRHQGCDAYNILLCAETLRSQKSLPIRLPPLFILEESEQWYPPGFLILCALVPPGVLRRYYWAVNHVVDVLHVSIAFLIVTALQGPWIAALVVIVYGMMGALVSEYASLNVRPFGMLLLSAFLLSAYAGMSSLPWALVAALVGLALFYTHKLSLQQLWFTLPVLAAVSLDWRWLAWLPAIYLLSFAVWPAGMKEIVRGHCNIVGFWTKYWPVLGAHAVRNSPVYGDARRPAGFYERDDLAGLLALLRDIGHANYFIVPVVVDGALRADRGQFAFFLLIWALSVYGPAIATHVLKPLRGLGLGRQYVKFGILPALLYLAMVLPSGTHAAVWALTLIAAVLTARNFIMVARDMRTAEIGQVAQQSDDLLDIVASLKATPGARLLCLPYHICDLVAYAARLPVYWGTHGQVFDEKLADFFPVLRRRIEEYAAGDRLSHLLLDTRYSSLETLGLRDDAVLERRGAFVLVRLGSG